VDCAQLHFTYCGPFRGLLPRRSSVHQIVLPCTAPSPVLEPDVKVSGLQLIVGHRILAFLGTAFTVSLCASYLGPPVISCSRAGEQLCVTLCHACGCDRHTVSRSASSQGEGDGVSIGLRCTAITPAGRMHLYGAPVSVSKIQ
jgi:hypothetical protein